MSSTDKLGRPLDKGSVVVASVGSREIAVGIVVLIAKKMARIKVFGTGNDETNEILRYPSELVVLSDQEDALAHIFKQC